MKSTTRYRFVRRFICVVAAIILAALWARSVVACDYLWTSTGETHFVVASCDGHASFVTTSTSSNSIWGDDGPFPMWKFERDYYYFGRVDFSEGVTHPVLFGSDIALGWWRTGLVQQQIRVPDPRGPLKLKDGISTIHPTAFWATANIIRLPYWLLLLISIGLLTKAEFAAARTFKALARDAARQGLSSCPSCGYDMRGTPDKCPECGFEPPHRDLVDSK